MRIHVLQKLLENDNQVFDAYQTWFNTVKYNWRKKETNLVTEAEALARFLVLLDERGLIKI